MPPGTLNGTGAGAGEPVYARAALLGEESGRPTIDAKILTEASRRFAQGDGETDLILVARDAAIALLVPLPEGLALAGVIAEQTVSSAFTANLPIVSGVVGALRQIADGELVILDAERGRVEVEPAPEEFARLQAERRRPRVFIGGPHVPARTQAGRLIEVWATATDDADIDRARASGADGVLLLDPTVFLPEDDEGEVDIRPLLLAADRLGGGEIGIVADPDEIDAHAVLAVAARANVRWILRPENLFQFPAELLTDLEQFARDAATTEEALADPSSVEPFEIPRLGALVAFSAADADFLAPGFDELFLDASAIDGWTVTDTFGRPPLRIVFSDDDTSDANAEDELPEDRLHQALMLDIAGVVVAPRHVGATKDFIRQQAY